MNTEPAFSLRVESIVALIPKGRVMTYGQIAAFCGQPRAARIIGGIAHFGSPVLPWHRVVNKQGGLASGYPGGRRNHKRDLESEGVIVNNKYVLNIEDYIWWPNQIVN